jgi:type III secretory pathway component EscS
MSDRTEEETVEKSTEELLSETEDILGDVSDGDPNAEDAAPRRDAGASSDAAGGLDDSLSDLGGTDTARESATDARGGSTATSTGGDDRRFRKYFDPKSAGVSAVLVLAGALAGGVVPLVGAFTQLLGVGGATFLHGLGASDSRYAETFVASAVVGGLVAAVTNLKFLAFGSAVPYLAITTALMVVVALVGHYFGRDLRAGLTQDVGTGGGGGNEDVPGW